MIDKKDLDFDVNYITDDFNSGFSEKRDGYDIVRKYILDKKPVQYRICTIIGIINTGKTVLMKQVMENLPEEEKKKTVFITCNQKTGFHNILSFMKDAIEEGFTNFFIDEISYAKDFQKIGEILSDNFVSFRNARVVVTGNDSLTFYLVSKSILYDRSLFVPTTFTTFPEFARILRNTSIDFYMEHGNTLSEANPFETQKSAKNYIETSIVSNLINSLEKSEGTRYYPVLTELYDTKDLENAIYRIMDNYSQSPVIKALRKQFEFTSLNNNVRKLLTIDDFKETITQEHLADIKAFLKEIDVITTIPAVTSDINTTEHTKMDFITNPGLYKGYIRYVLEKLKNNEYWEAEATKEQKEKLLENTYEFAMDELIGNLIIANVNEIMNQSRIISTLDLDGNPKDRWYVSKLNVEINGKKHESNLIIMDKKKNEVHLFEIKYSSESITNQAEHLDAPDFIAYVNKYFGNVKNRVVLYNGENDFSTEIPRISVSRFLTSLYRQRKTNEFNINDIIAGYK